MASSQKGLSWSSQFQVFGGWKGLQKASAMFLAGVGVMLVSTVSYNIWQWLREAWRVGTSSFVTSMELNSRDESYVWLMEWMNSQKWSKECRRVSVSSTWEEADEGHSKPVVLYTPDVGNYVIRYKGSKVWIKRTRDESNSSDQMARFGGVFETLQLKVWGNSRHVLESLIEEARETYMHREEGKTIIYTAVNGNWQRFGPPRPIRPLTSVILSNGLSERLVDDAHEFLKSSSWYSDRGIPYRRGYLLYGPPGTGKSSFVTALAGHLGMSICVVNLNNPDLSDEDLVYLLNRTPGKKCLLLIEDIDAAPSSLSRDTLNTSSSNQPPSRSKISLSGLLNALDGVASQEGRLLFMTTNHFSLLDSALSRPGRIDMKVQLGYADKDQIARLFVNFYPNQYLLASKFAEAIPNDLPVSSAHIQAHFMMFKHSPEGAFDHIKQLVDAVNQSHPETHTIPPTR
jgi:chaperone BCS1